MSANLDTSPHGRIMRRNWGYWDGVAAAKVGRHPQWCKPWNFRQRHPFDKIYGEGFWTGWYGEPAPRRTQSRRSRPSAAAQAALS